VALDPPNNPSATPGLGAPAPRLLRLPGLDPPGQAAAVRHSGASAVAQGGRAQSAARRGRARSLTHGTHNVLTRGCSSKGEVEEACEVLPWAELDKRSDVILQRLRPRSCLLMCTYSCSGSLAIR
jgi:hypothetical protein